MNARIAVLPGDGIGPEVTREAVRVLRAIGELAGHAFEFDEALIGGAAIDATGEPLPAATLEICHAADAVLLGAVGGPKWSDPRATVRPEQGLLGLRRALGLYANLRPARVHPALASRSPVRANLLDGVDILFVRELAGGLYFGGRPRYFIDGDTEVATDVSTYTTPEIERIVRVAGTLARQRSGSVVSVDKANVLETSRLWRSVTTRVMADEFPDVSLQHALVDAFAMQLIQQPARYDVVVTENLFGDILTDEAAAITGTIGLLPSASLGATPFAGARQEGLYEPIHGSAPDIAGQGLANPIGAILSAALLLRLSLGLDAEADVIERAVDGCIRDGVRTADTASPGENALETSEVGRLIAEAVARSGQSIPEGVA